MYIFFKPTKNQILLFLAVCLLSVLDGGVESALLAHNAVYGDLSEVTCSPLRTFEGFAENVLGVDAALTQRRHDRLNFDDASAGRFYWLDVIINSRGASC